MREGYHLTEGAQLERDAFDADGLRRKFGKEVSEPKGEWFLEPFAGKPFFEICANDPEPIDHRMYAPSKEPPGPMVVTDREIARRRKARKIASKSTRRNRR
jgi:hypothetical protein